MTFKINIPSKERERERKKKTNKKAGKQRTVEERSLPNVTPRKCTISRAKAGCVEPATMTVLFCNLCLVSGVTSL